MNKKFIHFMKNFSYSLTSNLVSFIISILIVLIIPKLIGVEEYGYWQLYIFYVSYVGFLHFGWNDGIYLRYGGKDYEKLDKPLFYSQFIMLMMSQAIFTSFIFVYSSLFVSNINKVFIFQTIAFVLLIVNARVMLQLILQSTNRIKEYAQITIMDKLLYMILIITFLLIGIRDFKFMIIADIIGKFISLLYAIYCCRDLVIHRISTFYFSFKETVINVSVGIKLMFSNIASMLIIGNVRFGIERTWDVSTFGKVSLTLSISNLMMLFINAMGIIMFPVLRRTDEERLPSIYNDEKFVDDH
ncbi:hypothetical protein [Chengkuizengella axinellae]|uniref:Polysaccharide biosynthesis protein n=1 Tax=Chengkuizengella axinellae TaxID=3064388 RepID=A0ABT9IZC9_9BACL|nr:hypothetical protein [Chengkuizengella sp. 2205SS18-9]MDP5274718.1 hypothetical protein [Chengkuizengella sp. 2205SS18-9]